MNAEKGNGTNSIVHKLANIHSYVIAKSQYTQNKSKRQEKGFPPPLFPYSLILQNKACTNKDTKVTEAVVYTTYICNQR